MLFTSIADSLRITVQVVTGQVETQLACTIAHYGSHPSRIVMIKKVYDSSRQVAPTIYTFQRKSNMKRYREYQF
jgi:hypothetical protein